MPRRGMVLHQVAYTYKAKKNNVSTTLHGCRQLPAVLSCLGLCPQPPSCPCEGRLPSRPWRKRGECYCCLSTGRRRRPGLEFLTKSAGRRGEEDAEWGHLHDFNKPFSLIPELRKMNPSSHQEETDRFQGRKRRGHADTTRLRDAVSHSLDDGSAPCPSRRDTPLRHGIVLGSARLKQQHRHRLVTLKFSSSQRRPSTAVPGRNVGPVL